MKKRITQADWEYIGKYNPARKWLRPIASYSLEKIEDGFRRNCDIPWLVYLIIFVPIHLLQALWCMWDGGLREFSIESRHVHHDDIHETWGNNKGAYPKVKEIWERAT